MMNLVVLYMNLTKNQLVLFLCLFILFCSGCLTQQPSEKPSPLESSRYISEASIENKTLQLTFVDNATYTHQWCRYDPAVGQLICTPIEKPTEITHVEITNLTNNTHSIYKNKSTYEKTQLSYGIAPSHNYSVTVTLANPKNNTLTTTFSVNKNLTIGKSK